MQQPRAQALPGLLLASAQHIARRVASAGQRAWIVGGPVRDLALEVEPMDLDMASALLPEEVEGLFERTSAVGKAFGTVLVHGDGIDVQLTTFRRERGFSDARRPDHVDYTERLEEDARRRDFTCNAMYLDPLNDELCDPEGGLADIRARLLRAVGDPGARFAEDGLRLVRLARFAASLDFEVDAPTLAAARAGSAALGGVSPERRLAELERIFNCVRSARAIELLDETGLLQLLLPGFSEVSSERSDIERKLRALRNLTGAGKVDSTEIVPGSALGLALLLDPDSERAAATAAKLLDFLKLSRALRQRIELLWRLRRAASQLARLPRASFVRFARQSEALDALRLARAFETADGGSGTELAHWTSAVSALSQAQKFPQAQITSDDLARAGVPRGPRWKLLLEAAETEQLEGRLQSREEALRWLELRAQDASRG